MSKEERYNSIAEAFQKGKGDPYSGLRERIKPEGARLWLDALRRQREGKSPTPIIKSVKTQ